MKAPGTAPHGGRTVEVHGARPSAARAAALLVHGRGGSAGDMVALARRIRAREPDGLEDVAWIAPSAADSTWYPESFLAPLERNRAGFESGFSVLEGLLGSLEREGVPAERVVLIGFSQGACLALELAARHPRRYGGIAGLSGGLLGPAGTERSYPGSFDGTPVFLGCSDIDPHVPRERVAETAAVFAAMGARVTERIYPGTGHVVNDDEVSEVARIVRGAASAVRPAPEGDE